MVSSLHNRVIHAVISSDDEYTTESYDYEMVDNMTVEEDQHHLQPYVKTSDSSVSIVETVEDDYDEYTYEEDDEDALEVVMENNEDDTDSTAAPPPLPTYRANGPGSYSSPAIFKPPIPSKPLSAYVPSSPVTWTSSIGPSYDVKKAPVLLTPSKQRSEAANSMGLSELSKQLRILQAKNESQAVDINHKERQLRILADLQGISVDDLRKALENACASEAFGELQHRVSKLKYELEAATLAKQAEMRKDGAAPYIANLELRVGELEEVEEKQKKEIRDLYENLRQEQARSTQFESEKDQLKGALQNMIHRVQSETARAAQVETNFQKQIQDLRERQSKKVQEEAERSRGRQSSAGKPARQGAGNPFGMVSPEMAAEYEQMVQLLKKKDEELRNAQAKLYADEIRRAETFKDVEERSRQVEMKMKVKADKLALTVKELEDADGQNGLRLAQFKARFVVQDERVVDQRQQLNSLYTAFDLLKEESDSEHARHATILSNLNDADAEIARQTKKMEEVNNESRHEHNHGFPSSPVAGNSGGVSKAAHGSKKALTPYHVSTSPGVTARRPVISTLAPVLLATPVTTGAHYNMTPYSNHTTDRSTDFEASPAAPVTDVVHYSMTPNSNNTTDGSYDYNVDISTTYDYNIDTPTATAQAFHPTPQKTPSTWEILSDRTGPRGSGPMGDHREVEGQLILGFLLVESNSMLRRWKKKPSAIYLRGEGYQWEIGTDSSQWEFGDRKSFPLKFGISKVEFHPNRPLAFAVYLDPTMANGPVIRAAAVNELDYHCWMTALYKATTGEEYIGGGGADALEKLSASFPITNARAQLSAKEPTGARTEFPAKESEDADLQRILEISKYCT